MHGMHGMHTVNKEIDVIIHLRCLFHKSSVLPNPSSYVVAWLPTELASVF